MADPFAESEFERKTTRRAIVFCLGYTVFCAAMFLLWTAGVLERHRLNDEHIYIERTNIVTVLDAECWANYTNLLQNWRKREMELKTK